MPIPEGDMREMLGELKAEIRGLREDVGEIRKSAEAAKITAEEADKKLEAMKNRGYGFIGGAMLLAGAAGAKIQSIIFGS